MPSSGLIPGWNHLFWLLGSAMLIKYFFINCTIESLIMHNDETLWLQKCDPSQLRDKLMWDSAAMVRSPSCMAAMRPLFYAILRVLGLNLCGQKTPIILNPLLPRFLKHKSHTLRLLAYTHTNLCNICT